MSRRELVSECSDAIVQQVAPATLSRHKAALHAAAALVGVQKLPEGLSAEVFHRRNARNHLTVILRLEEKSNANQATVFPAPSLK